MNDNRKRMMKVVLKETKAATTVVIMGPSGNGKSTTISSVLPTSSNKLLGQNIGDVSQTSLIWTKISLSTSLQNNEVCIKCKPKKHSLEFQDSLQNEAIEIIYMFRDELDEITVDNNVIERVLNPADKSFHAYEFATKNGMDIAGLAEAFSNLLESIVNEPVEINEEVNDRLKELKKAGKKPKKKEVFQDIVMNRFGENEQTVEKLANWYENFLGKINEFYNKYWDDAEEYFIYGDIETDDRISEFIQEVYAKNSVFSLAFTELQYVVRPNDDFINVCEKKYGKSEDNKLVFNLLDTIGLTQTGEEKEIINDAIDNILGQPIDACLFLCATDEKATVYQYCMEVLNTNTKKLSSIPFTICRTKADVILRNKMVNICRKETGANMIPEDRYAEFLISAYHEFEEEIVKNYSLSEDKIGYNVENSNDVVEYISLAPDLYQKMQEAISNEIAVNDENHILIILANLFYAVDKKYEELQIVKISGKNTDLAPIQIRIKPEYIESLADGMVKMNLKDSKQYTEFINGRYHGFSISTYLRKHPIGVGHETNAHVYDNFKLFIKNLIKKWLNYYLSDRCKCAYSIDYSNLFMADESKKIEFIKAFEEHFSELLEIAYDNMIDRIAKRLSYDCIEESFWKCYDWKSRQEGFKENLELFSNAFSDIEYWKRSVSLQFENEMSIIVAKMCVVVEEQ